MLLKVLLSHIMCNSYILWKTIYTISNFDIDFSIVCNVIEVIFNDILLHYDVNMKFHLFVMIHWWIEIKNWYF